MFSLLVLTTFACTLVAGGVPALWNIIPSALAQRFAVPEDRVRHWRKWYLLALVVLFPLAGLLVDTWNSQTVLFAGVLAAALALAWLGLAQKTRACFLAILFLAIAHAFVTVPTIVLFRHALPFDIPNLHGKRIAAMNIGFIGIALGTLMTPRLVRALLARLGPGNGFLVLALACLLPGVLVALTGRDDFPRAHVGIPWHELSEDPRWWLLLSLGFFYFPLEYLLDAWRRRYFVQIDPANRLARPGYWTLLLIMRLAIGWMIWDGYEAWGLTCLALAFAIIAGNLASAYAPTANPWGIWLIGATFGPLLPTLLAIVTTLYEQNEGAMVGFILALGAIGGLVLQPMMSSFAERNPLPVTMRFNMILALTWGALALVLALMGYLSTV